MILENTGSPEPPPSEEALRDEERRARRLRLVVDITCSVLMQAQLTRAEAEDVVATARRCALELFPDKEETFDLILAPRFERLMAEFIGPRRILPFKPRG